MAPKSDQCGINGRVSPCFRYASHLIGMDLGTMIVQICHIPALTPVQSEHRHHDGISDGSVMEFTTAGTSDFCGGAAISGEGLHNGG